MVKSMEHVKGIFLNYPSSCPETLGLYCSHKFQCFYASAVFKTRMNIKKKHTDEARWILKKAAQAK